ncbi:MAG: hypothetical protein RL268_980 [Pseudomonadota bacterium]
MSHAFLSAMEDSGSVGPGSGWSPAPIVIADAAGTLASALPAYLKSHSQGEYVFDHAWADAWHRAGGSYYPKMQIAAPFTPATGPRLLLADDALAPALLRAAEQVCADNGLSSAHATFIAPDGKTGAIPASTNSSARYPRASARTSARSARRRSRGWKSAP